MPKIISENIDLYYNEIGSGTPVLMLHGGPGVDHKYMRNLKALSEKYRLIFVDQRGNGNSKIKDYDTLQFKFFTSDLENLRRYLNIEKWIIIGHSFGGFVALEYALRYSAAISNLILLDTGFNAKQVQVESIKNLIEWGYSKSTVKWAKKFFNGDLNICQIPYAFLKFGSAYSYKFDYTVLKNSMSGKHTLKTTLLWFKKYFQDWDIQNKLHEIQIPALIVTGERDFQFPPEYQAIMAKEIANSTVKIIENAGHNTPLECPDKVVDIIYTYLN